MWPNLNYYDLQNQAKILISGGPYLEHLELLISQAKYYIHIQVYIFQLDETGKKILQLLIQAQKRGVQIFLLVDGIGSSEMEEKTINKIKHHGINIEKFSAPFSYKSVEIGRRLHHKVIIVDHLYAIVGGLNISDDYLKADIKIPWLDFAVLIKGQTVLKINTYCEEIFSYNGRDQNIFFPPIRSLTADSPSTTPLRMRINDWVKGKHEINSSYLDAITNCKKSFTLINSYFFPGRKFIKRLKEASLRGVEVNIIFPRFSDAPLLKYATDYLYEELITYRINLYEWNHSIVHAKVALVDDIWCTIGSYNLNYSSFFGNIEMNIDLVDQENVSIFKNIMDELISKGCVAITSKELRKNLSFFGQIRNFICYLIFRSMGAMYLTFFSKNDPSLLERTF